MRDEFPQSAMLGDNAVRVEMDASVLLGGINRAVFATADDELRPVMNGIYFDITTEDITMVASDGHKLVRCKTLAAKGNERAAFILPKKPASLIKNLLPKEQGQVVIEFDERNAVFTLEKYRMVCRLIEGRYPNYNSVIPQNNPYKVTVDRMQSSFSSCSTGMMTPARDGSASSIITSSAAILFKISIRKVDQKPDCFF